MTRLRLADMMMIATKLSWLQQIKISKCLMDNYSDRQCCTTECHIFSDSLILYVSRTQTISPHKLSQDSKRLVVLSTKGAASRESASQVLPKKNSIRLFNVTLQCNMFRAKFNSFRSQIHFFHACNFWTWQMSKHELAWLRSELSNRFGPKMLCRLEKIGHDNCKKYLVPKKQKNDPTILSDMHEIVHVLHVYKYFQGILVCI